MRITTSALMIFLLALNIVVVTGCEMQNSNDVTEISTPQDTNTLETNELMDETEFRIWLENAINELSGEYFEGDLSFYIDVIMEEFYRNREIRNLSLIPGIDDPVIMVNGSPITRREIERQHIIAQGTRSLNDVIVQMIRDKVVIQEAVRLGLELDQSRLNNTMEIIIEVMSDSSEFSYILITTQIKGLGVTEAGVLAMMQEDFYKIILTSQLFDHIIDEAREEIGWHISYSSDSEQEFFERYVDDLVNNAHIEFLSADYVVLNFTN